MADLGNIKMDDIAIAIRTIQNRVGNVEGYYYNGNFYKDD